MSMLVWVMMGIAVWHFTVFVPDRFWGGIVGAFLAAAVAAAVFGLVVNGGSIPGQSDTDIIQALIAIPGAAIGLGLSYSMVRASIASTGSTTATRATACAERFPCVPSARPQRMGRMLSKPSRWSCDPYDVALAERLAAGLGVSRPVGAILARRGFASVEDARDFLEAARAARPAHAARPRRCPRADRRSRRARLAHRRLRRLRRRRRLLHGDPGAHAAGARRRPRLGAAQPLRRGLRPVDRRRRAAGRARAWGCSSPSTAGSPPWSRSRPPGRPGSTWWSPTTTARATRCPTASSCTPRSAATAAPSCAPPAWRSS